MRGTPPSTPRPRHPPTPRTSPACAWGRALPATATAALGSRPSPTPIRRTRKTRAFSGRLHGAPGTFRSERAIPVAHRKLGRAAESAQKQGRTRSPGRQNAKSRSEPKRHTTPPGPLNSSARARKRGKSWESHSLPGRRREEMGPAGSSRRSRLGSSELVKRTLDPAAARRAVHAKSPGTCPGVLGLGREDAKRTDCSCQPDSSKRMLAKCLRTERKKGRKARSPFALPVKQTGVLMPFCTRS